MNKAVKPGTLIRRATDIVATEMDGEYLLMSIEQGSYIALRDVSARIWEILERPSTFTALLESLLRDYTVDPAVCKQEVADFLQQMAASKLINLDQAA